jgi:hypothetical protein
MDTPERRVWCQRTQEAQRQGDFTNNFSIHIFMPTPSSFERELHISMPNYKTLCFYTKLWNIHDYMPNHRAFAFSLDY